MKLNLVSEADLTRPETENIKLRLARVEAKEISTVTLGAIANSLLTTRGDLIVRNATVPDRLALTVPASPIINVLGVANGETQPTWKSASSAGGADAHVLATDASGHTQVVAIKASAPGISVIGGTAQSGVASIVEVAGNFGTYAALNFFDTRTAAAGTGGSIAGSGWANGTGTPARFGQLAMLKQNATAGDFKGKWELQLNNGTDATTMTTMAVILGSNRAWGIGVDPPTFSDGSGVHLHNPAGTVRFHITNVTTGAAAGDGAEFTVAGSDLYIVQNENAKIYFYANGSEAMQIEAAGNLALASGKVLKIGGNQVVGARGAAVADATDAASVILRLNDLLARLRTHGLIAT